MDIDIYISSLEETLSYLLNSESSNYSHISVDEVIERLRFEISVVKEIHQVNQELLRLLFGPTGPIQEISIDNGWGDDFLKLSEIVDKFTERT